VGLKELEPEQRRRVHFRGKKQIDESQGQIPGRGMALAGIILGAVAIVIAIVYWILFAAGVFDDISYNFETS